MKVRSIVLAAGFLAGGGLLSALPTLAGCATDEASSERDETKDATSSDARVDVDMDLDAGPCSDCEYFPASCSATDLCPNGPFDPTNPSNGLDWRTQVNVIRGRSADDVWMAGALGALAHFDGTTWTRSDFGGRETLRALWLRESTEASLARLENMYTRGIAIEDGGADAAAPSPSPDGWTARAVAPGNIPLLPPDDFGYPTYGQLLFASAWSTPSSEWLWCTTRTKYSSYAGIWRVHFAPERRRFEFERGVPAGACATLPCRSMSSIHGISADHLWAVGALGASVRITHAESASPTVVGYNTRTVRVLNGVWAAAENDVWAVGEGGLMRHYTGDPITWDIVEDVPTAESLNAIWGATPSDIWAVGDKGVALHYDGARWSRVKIAGLGVRRPDLTTVWMPSPDHVWIGGQGVVLSLGGKP